MRLREDRRILDDEDERKKADIACNEILEVANSFLARSPNQPPNRRLLRRKGGMAEAVCIVRRKKLVSQETLITAGFKPWR